jgi:ABC-type uncharacterized transport system auxiliary subunit
MRRIATLVLSAALAGCVGLRSTQAHRYFVLGAGASAEPYVAAPSSSHDDVLLIGPATVATFFDTQAIAFSRSAGELGYYQYSSWAEPPGRRIAPLLATALGRRAEFRAVAIAGSGVRGRFLLSAHLEEIVHDAAVPPGVARVAMVAELVDLRQHALLARSAFTATAPLDAAQADAAARACGRALGDVLEQVAAWAGGVAKP